MIEITKPFIEVIIPDRYILYGIRNFIVGRLEKHGIKLASETEKRLNDFPVITYQDQKYIDLAALAANNAISNFRYDYLIEGNCNPFCLEFINTKSCGKCAYKMKRGRSKCKDNRASFRGAMARSLGTAIYSDILDFLGSEHELSDEIRIEFEYWRKTGRGRILGRESFTTKTKGVIHNDGQVAYEAEIEFIRYLQSLDNNSFRLDA